jgi:hypothetical protein
VLEPGGVGGGGVGRQLRRLAREGHHHAQPGGLQVAGHDEAVAAVVARPAGHQHAAGAVEEAQGQRGGGGPGALHQGRHGAGEGAGFDGADAGDGVDRAGGSEAGGRHGRQGALAMPTF